MDCLKLITIVGIKVHSAFDFYKIPKHSWVWIYRDHASFPIQLYAKSI